MPESVRDDRATALCRGLALGFSLLSAVVAAALLAQSVAVDGLQPLDFAAILLILLTTAWLSWGAAQSFVGLLPHRAGRAASPRPGPMPPTVVLLPICNEDPVAAMTRISVMDASCHAAGLDVHFAVLSDTRDPAALEREAREFARLRQRDGASERFFYRNRTDNRGRKAGNIEDFVRRHGAAYEFAIMLDADSLMEGQTIATLISRMRDEPDLGLLQTLPVVVGARSLFGRAMQFAASFHSPVFARGLARMQGRTGPFWGHNAIVRLRALAECCALPELSGRPPFGGTIMSHDYVEAALLARGGWRVTLDETLSGSFEEGPDNLLSHVRRDRRWCQGNLQYLRLLNVPDLRKWSRFVFVQGIASYLISLFWGVFLVVSVLATITAPLPNYFPEPNQLFPVFPDDRTREFVALCIGIGGLLLLPKIAIFAEAVATRRVACFGGAARAFASVLSEILLSSLIAPVLLMYQSRSVIEVLSGHDGGWPANQRGEGRLTLAEGWIAGRWIALTGLAVATAVGWLAPALIWWLLPVCVPMMAAPILIWATSQPRARSLFRVPDEIDPAPVVAAYRSEMAKREAHADKPDQVSTKASDVVRS
ncbi:glucans biosynthesis glucosyltransferase MdoH [Palleronia sp. LCG004]|uniref:glucans biosynthesis glucosyltransferase MdoH n=1 Tax=Palleronia sp. LCG004 TaxID=3079304 RepID=UPI00294305D5|nr:glucans biosynthesis glucosyltransferase MdoH [Palleronia sp. LCG004]WOI56735.1 glucans biosynthesis glucosyltransferase MdoH [Palleronia sp. LCG004]